MDAMNFAGRRGEVSWKASLLGRQLSYDTWRVQFALIAPISLGDAVHVWDLPQTRLGGPCKAIPLRPDPDFRRSVLVGNWIGWGAALACIALLLGAIGLFANLYFILAGAMFVASIVAGSLGVWLTRRPGERRQRDVRLLLGLHEWGGSDPATWSELLVARVVDPKAALGVESFAALAEREQARRQWGEAVWAARLSAAVEDAIRGEELTDAILAEPEVAERLRRVRRRPGNRDKEFGSAPGLRKWVNCNPVDHIMLIG